MFYSIYNKFSDKNNYIFFLFITNKIVVKKAINDILYNPKHFQIAVDHLKEKIVSL